MTKAQRNEHKAKMARIHAEAQQIVASGKCPDCGSGLRRNITLTGWWQCGCYGTDAFRSPEYRGKTSCNFQCFTE